MELRPLVDEYLRLAGEFGRPVALERLGRPRREVERFFSALDEDYFISRFLNLSREAGAAEFNINGFIYTHVAFKGGVRTIL